MDSGCSLARGSYKEYLSMGVFEIKSKIDSYLTELISDLFLNSKLQHKTFELWLWLK